jgi:hypothetical protein
MLDIRQDTKAKFRVVEGISGHWHYHLAPWTTAGIPTALCSARVMATSIPVSAWGTQTHLGEKWCANCEQKAREFECNEERKP